MQDRAALRAAYRRTVVRSHLTTDLRERATLQASAAELWGTLTASAGFDGATIMLLVEGDDQVTYPDGGSGPLHCTICYCGPAADLDDNEKMGLVDAGRRVADNLDPFEAGINGPAVFGGETPVKLVEHEDLLAARHYAMDDPLVVRLDNEHNDHPIYTPHVSGLGDVDTGRFDRVAVTLGDEQHVYPLGGAEPDFLQLPDDDEDLDLDEDEDLLRQGA